MAHADSVADASAMRPLLTCLAAAAAVLVVSPAALGAVREMKGPIVELSATRIAVRRASGAELNCGFGAHSPHPTGVRAGDVVLLSCLADSDFDVGSGPWIVGAP